MSGGGSPAAAPANTTSQSTNTVIQEAPAYEQQYITQLLGQASAAASQPYQQFPGQQVADLTPDQLQSFSNVENLVDSGQAANAGTAATNSATAATNTANNIYGAGAGDINASTGYNPLAAAAPLLNAAANDTTPQGISSYMSPYTNSVVTGLENTANQNWNQNIMPGVNNEFINAGQSGSGRNAQVLGQAANQFQTNLDTSVANALQSGYGQASTNATNAANTLGNLANTASSATSAQAANLQNAGTGLGNLAATQSGAQGAAATNLANTANTVQNTGITGASALQAVGQQQQNQNQSNINAAMTNFQNQVQYPEQQLGFLSNIVNGLPAQTSTTGAAQTPTTTNQIGSTSPLSTLAGTLIGAGSLGSTGSKKGGLIKGYASGGVVDPPSDVQVDPNAPTDIPPVNASNLSPLQYASNDNSGSDETPSSVALPSDSNSNARSNPLRTIDPQVTDSGTQGRNFQLLSLARGLLTPAHSGAEALGNGIGDYLQTSMGMPDYQMKQLALQKQQAIQPMQIQMMTQGLGPSSSLGSTPNGSTGNGSVTQSNGSIVPQGGINSLSTVEQYGANALRAAYMSGDPKQISTAYLSLYEHNPELAGAIKNAQEKNTFQKTPQGTFVMPGQSASNPSSTAPAAAQSTNAVNTNLTAMDGKPIIPSASNIDKYKPDPNGMPSYNTPNTETGVALQKGLQDEDLKANSEMTSNLSSIQHEQYRLQQMANVYQQTQSGTLLAQNPDIAKQLVGWGVINDPSQIHDLSMIQKGLANQAIQIIQQTKDANANLGGAPTRLFGSEIANMQQKAENPSATPEANYEVITDAMGLANHSADMAKGWDAIGGLGNRMANGVTLRPADYARQFIENHDPQDYKQAAMKSLPPFKGMTASNANSQKTNNWVRVNGKLVQQ